MTSVHGSQYRRFLGRLRDARRHAGLTQVQAAAKLRVTQTYISKCERGERRIDVIELQKFAKLYGLPLSWFVEEST